MLAGRARDGRFEGRTGHSLPVRTSEDWVGQDPRQLLRLLLPLLLPLPNVPAEVGGGKLKKKNKFQVRFATYSNKEEAEVSIFLNNTLTPCGFRCASM